MVVYCVYSNTMILKSNIILFGGLKELRAVVNVTFNPASYNFIVSKCSARLILSDITGKNILPN